MGCFITVHDPAITDFFATQSVSYGNNPVLDGAGSGTCTFALPANGLDKAVTYDMRARVDSGAEPGRNSWSGANIFPVFAQIGDFPIDAVDACANALVSPSAAPGSAGSGGKDFIP
jgi:hypothetical protein